jgi:hypothetical protein
MSIRLMIKEWVNSGELIFLTPLLDFIPIRREIFVSKEILEALDGPWASRTDEKNAGRARALLDRFTEGAKISVRLPPSRDVTAQLALLEGAKDQVWEFRCCESTPQIRIFGHFADKDLFVAFFLVNRNDIPTYADFHPLKEECKRRWRKYFPTYPTRVGSEADDYVSNCVSV